MRVYVTRFTVRFPCLYFSPWTKLMARVFPWFSWIVLTLTTTPKKFCANTPKWKSRSTRSTSRGIVSSPIDSSENFKKLRKWYVLAIVLHLGKVKKSLCLDLIHKALITWIYILKAVELKKYQTKAVFCESMINRWSLLTITLFMINSANWCYW